MDDSYYTIRMPARCELKAKGSRFIGESHLVVSTDEALQILQQTRKRERGASHHCYAYRLGTADAAIFKYSDAGEPSGTGGKPIFDVLCGHELTNTLVVVTRYFGGTKLGTGGLVRAYARTAQSTIEKSGVQQRYVTENLVVRFPFPLIDAVTRLLHQYLATRTKADYGEDVTLEVEVRRSLAEKLAADVIQLSSGTASVGRKESG